MRKIAFLVIVVLSVLFAFVSFGIADEDTAMVMDIRGGTAHLETGKGSSREIMPMDFVSEGDRIRLENRTVMVLNYFASGIREEISGSGIIIVGNSSSKVEGGLKIKSERLPCKLPKSSAKGSDLQQSGNVSLLGKPECSRIEILTLIDTKVRMAEPVFQWKPLERVQEYKLSVFDADSKVRWETKTETSAIPWAMATLKPGEEYWWTITAIRDGKTVAKGDGRFSVLNKEELEKLHRIEKYILEHCPKGSAERLIFLGLTYKDFNLMDDARAIFRKLHDSYPENNNFALYLEKIDPNFKGE